MEVWASRYGKQVQFLMVCVDAAGSLYSIHKISYFLILIHVNTHNLTFPGVAIQFGKMFGLKNAVNCWIPSRGYMPVG